MSWNDVLVETNKLKERIDVLLKFNLADNPLGIQYFLWTEEKPPMVLIHMYVDPDDDRREYIFNPLRAAIVMNKELEKMGEIMTIIANLHGIKICEGLWEKQGLRRYRVGIDYSLFLPKRSKK